MFGLDLLAKLFKILRSEDSPNKIAFGFVMGMIIGLTPLWTIHNLILIVLIVILRVNIGASLFGYIIFGMLAYVLDPVFHSFGYYLLVDVAVLHGFWARLYQIPVVALSHYNNTVVIGSLVSSIILFIPVFFAMKYFVVWYRRVVDPKLQKLRIVQIFKATKFYRMYEKIKIIGG